jgi:uncharacterized phage-associated protein
VPCCLLHRPLPRLAALGVALTFGLALAFRKYRRYALRVGTVHDLAAYILREQGPMSTWKLQKLVYNTQAWALVWDEEPIFKAEIQAWANGPVVPELYKRHRGRFSVDSWDGDPDKLSSDHRDTVEIVLGEYGQLTGRQLSLLTHAERPWQKGRKGLEPTQLGSQTIPLDSIQAYYEALDADPDMPSVSAIDWAKLEAG